MAEIDNNIKELDLTTTTMNARSVGDGSPTTFALATYIPDGNGKPSSVICSGILSEMPEFGLSPVYDLSPGRTVLDAYTNAFKQDMFDMAAVLMSTSNTNETATPSSWRNLIQTGALTRGVFKSISYNDISLKFKVYSNNSFGQTDAKYWITVLSSYATPNYNNEKNSSNLLENIEGALSMLSNGGECITKLFKAQSGSDGTSPPTTNKDALIRDKFKRAGACIARFFATADSLGSINANNTLKVYAKEHSVGGPDAVNKLIYFFYYFLINKQIYLLSSEGKVVQYGEETGKINIDSEFKKYAWFVIDSKNGSQDFGDTELGKSLNPQMPADPSKPQNSTKPKVPGGYGYLGKIVEQYKKGLTELGDEGGDEAFIKRNSTKIRLEAISDELKEILESTDIPEEPKFLEQVNEKLITLKNYAENFIQKSPFLTDYDNYRVIRSNNLNNIYGEKLWHLFIYNDFLFKNPINVCITNWTVAPSSVVSFNGPVYYEFTINCKLDQIPSSTTWFDYYISDYAKKASGLDDPLASPFVVQEQKQKQKQK